MFSVVPVVIYSHRQSWGGTRTLSVASFASASLLPLLFLCFLLPPPTSGISQLCVVYTLELYYRKREMRKTKNEWEVGTLKWILINSHECIWVKYTCASITSGECTNLSALCLGSELFGVWSSPCLNCHCSHVEGQDLYKHININIQW